MDRRKIILLAAGLACLASFLLTASLLANARPWHEEAIWIAFSACGLVFFTFVYRSRWRANVILSVTLALWLAPLLAFVILQEETQYRQETEFFKALDLDSMAIADHEFAARSDIKAEIHQYFRSQPGITCSAHPPKRDSERTASDVMNGNFRFLGKPAHKMKSGIDWDEDPFSDRSWNWSLHVMRYVADLTHVAGKRNNPAYLQAAEDLVFDWIQDNYLVRQSEVPSKMTWHDHATALRLMAWLVFWESWHKSELADADEIVLFLSTVIAHAEKLAHPDFYTPSHNHGIDQDFALIALSACLPELKMSNQWRNLAVKRLNVQITDTISKNGVHLEHSPGYHLSTFRLLHEIDKFSRNHGLEVLPDQGLKRLLEKMANFLAYVTKPNGSFPLIGDTTPRQIVRNEILKDYAQKDPILQYVLSRGKSGQPGKVTKIYKDEGYAFLRDSWKPKDGFSQGTYIAFSAAANEGRAHKHSDDLSFVLSAHGQDLLVDAGRHSYKHGSPERNFVISAAAHNVVLVDHKGFSGFTANIDSHSHEPPVSTIEAHHENYPGTTHRRSLVYLRPNRLLLIDAIKPTHKKNESLMKNHEYTQLFHLARNAKVLTRESGQTYASSGDVFLRIKQLLWSDKDSQEVVEGSLEPYQGWISYKHGELTSAPVVSFNKTGSSALFITFLDWQKEQQTTTPHISTSIDSANSIVRLSAPYQEGLIEIKIDNNGIATLDIIPIN